MELNPNKKNIPVEIYLVSVAVLFAIINLLGTAKMFSTGVNILFTPLLSIGSEIGNSINTITETVPSIGEIRKERNDLILENAELKAKLSSYLLLEEELLDLRSQYEYDQDLTDKEIASILSWGYGSIEGNVILNKGSEDGISYGDIVSIGNIYLGMINELGQDHSSMILPINGRSRLTVLIIPFQADVTTLTEDEANTLVNNNSVRYWNAIAIGSGGVINLENIPKNSSVQVGDHVFIADEDVPEHYYLGDISRIIYDPADVQIRAVVSQPLIINNITKVFITKTGE